MESKKEISEPETPIRHVSDSPTKPSINSPANPASPAKPTSNSPAKLNVNSSPARQVPLSDYSPLKGPKSIASFFTPPQPVKPSSLSASPQKITSYSSPMAPTVANPSNLKIQTKVEADDSGSDLTLSEGESEEEEQEAVKSEKIESPKKHESPKKTENVNEEEEGDEEEEEEEEEEAEEAEAEDISFKPVSARGSGIPFNLTEDEEEEGVEIEAETSEESEEPEENENESDSDISVIISLPSTDSNEPVTVSRRFADLSNSEYESISDDDDVEIEEEEEESKIIDALIVSDDDEEEEKTEIPVMVFNSNEIIIQSSPEKKPSSPEKRNPVVPPVQMPEKKIPPKRSYEIPTQPKYDLTAIKESIKQGIESIEQRSGKSLTDEQIRNLVKSSFADAENKPPSPKKRAVDTALIAEDIIHFKKTHLSQPTRITNHTAVKPVSQPIAHPSIQSQPVRFAVQTAPDAVSMPLTQPAIPNPQITRILPPPVVNHSTRPVHHNIRPVPVPPQQSQPAPIVNREINGNFNAIPAAAAVINSQVSVPIKSKTGYVYDERMLHHFDPHDPEHPEKPARISSIYEKLRSAKLLEKSHRIPVQVKMNEFAPEVQSVHETKYCRMVNQTSLIRDLGELNQISSQFNSVYFNPSTAISATVAAAATIGLCDAIGKGEVENGFAIVRPPGHHAEHDEAMGFCIYNNVAVAASSLLRKNLARKILILDWDVHHGNGTQNAFAESGDVLYVSLHRYDGAKFYPHFEEANYSYVGAGTAGLGK